MVKVKFLLLSLQIPYFITYNAVYSPFALPPHCEKYITMIIIIKTIIIKNKMGRLGGSVN